MGDEIRSAVDIAMAGERPMDSNNEQNSPGTPVKSAVEIAMAGGPRPMDGNDTKQETQYGGVAPQAGNYESQGSSQTEVDLSKYNENLTPSTNTVIENWDKNMSNTPSLVTVTEKTTPNKPEKITQESSDKKPFFDLEFGSDEEIKKRDLHQEALDRNNKANEGFTGKFSQRGSDALAAQDRFAEMAKENAMLQERLAALEKKMAEMNKQYDDPNLLQNSLDPNRPRPLNPLEQVQKTLLEQENERQAKFGADVENARLQHDPTYKPNLVPPVTPEFTKQTALEAAEGERRERNWKRAALIAGVVVGGTGGVLGGTPVAAVGGLVCVGAGILSKGLDYIGGKRIQKLAEQLDSTEDPEQRAKLEKRISNWEKVRKGSEYLRSFLKGATIGFAASGIAMGIFNGGHGLVWNKPEGIIPNGTPSGSPKDGFGPNSSPSGNPGSVPGPEASPVSPETYPGNSFIHDGRVDLPGSAWDGNLAGGPAQDTLRGGMENFANYTGGPSEMAANQLGQDLASNNITDELLSNLTTYDKHRLLTEYWDAIRAGNVNPELIETLKGMNTDGAQKLLAAIGK